MSDTPQTPGDDAQAMADEWASAMAEQTAAEPAAAAPQPAFAQSAPAAPVFQPLAATAGNPATATHNDIDLILDIPVQMTVELGRTKIAIKNLLQLAQGSVVELDGMAGEPMDVLVNGCLIAQGEVVVVNDKFGIRLTDIITPSERIRKLNR
ncbi:flagellar motor switch protein FliN [Pandoraea captiosa]|jgi:flagellar motor switch protein FliN/FliY|uniref:Flagellar motor switch protein FliN n=1 Tax=Pandoraea captiosa TaxID=2508302 RepID=A0A5E5ADQ8_9BURK|nr:flagellar motor switch protein FliN [Pandoraea captiosa]VVE70633.1 flagellar motor switch protein FliN [Pandoraea captiosa]